MPTCPPSPAPLCAAAWYVGIGILALTLMAVVSSGFFFLRHRRRAIEATSQQPRPARRPRDHEQPKPPEPFRGVIVLVSLRSQPQAGALVHGGSP